MRRELLASYFNCSALNVGEASRKGDFLSVTTDALAELKIETGRDELASSPCFRQKEDLVRALRVRLWPRAKLLPMILLLRENCSASSLVA
jgi:hypothetical protein